MAFAQENMAAATRSLQKLAVLLSAAEQSFWQRFGLKAIHAHTAYCYSSGSLIFSIGEGGGGYPETLSLKPSTLKPQPHFVPKTLNPKP